ncbi:MAG: hypothetical protein RLY57_670 [Candidatus Parcubacteria bacterium]|jgi:hypothetical protein
MVREEVSDDYVQNSCNHYTEKSVADEGAFHGLCLTRSIAF